MASTAASVAAVKALPSVQASCPTRATQSTTPCTRLRSWVTSSARCVSLWVRDATCSHASMHSRHAFMGSLASATNLLSSAAEDPPGSGVRTARCGRPRWRLPSGVPAWLWLCSAGLPASPAPGGVETLKLAAFWRRPFCAFNARVFMVAIMRYSSASIAVVTIAFMLSSGAASWTLTFQRTSCAMPDCCASVVTWVQSARPPATPLSNEAIAQVKNLVRERTCARK
mmetsp:Transcript_46359/g.118372  ORF Transcript_46359/g.118372 Transcript_46359/m.118372 type:complete len:227 (+) Transcript_46359:114-794(+)